MPSVTREGEVLRPVEAAPARGRSLDATEVYRRQVRSTVIQNGCTFLACFNGRQVGYPFSDGRKPDLATTSTVCHGRQLYASYLAGKENETPPFLGYAVIAAIDGFHGELIIEPM
jgi:hypothetical protein